MASIRRRQATSSAVAKSGTILGTAVRIIKNSGNIPLAPREIADIGQYDGFLRVPRGRNEGYLGQLVQSVLYNNILSPDPIVFRTSYGKYKLRRAAFSK